MVSNPHGCAFGLLDHYPDDCSGIAGLFCVGSVICCGCTGDLAESLKSVVMAVVVSVRHGFESGVMTKE